MEWILTTANAAETKGLMYLPNHGGTRIINFSHPSDDQPLQTLLNFYDRTDRVISAPSAYLAMKQWFLVSLSPLTLFLSKSYLR
jgi:hypothetical protein